MPSSTYLKPWREQQRSPLACRSTPISEASVRAIFPVGAPTFAEALRYGTETFQALKKILHGKGLRNFRW